MQELDRDPLEYANWRDTGCDLHPCCLECPLPRCIEEQSRGRQRQKMEVRAADMQALASAGSTVREIAAVYSVSERTVQRELHRRGKIGEERRWKEC